jgi:hypothetical protein
MFCGRVQFATVGAAQFHGIRCDAGQIRDEDQRNGSRCLTVFSRTAEATSRRVASQAALKRADNEQQIPAAADTGSNSCPADACRATYPRVHPDFRK